MKAKIITLFLILAASMGNIFASVLIGDLYYTLDDNSRTAKVTCKSFNSNNGFNAGWDITNASIPASITYNGNMYSVTSIGVNAFRNCFSLTSVTIPNSVTRIEGSAFEDCSSLKSITFGNNVTTIALWAFRGCDNLNIIWNVKNYPDCQEYYKTPFYQVWPNTATYDVRESIASFTFGEDVEHIPAYLCFGMKNITSINIPNSVKSIGSAAFSGCSKLAKVKISSIAAWCAITFGSQDSNPLTSAHHLYLNNKEVTNITIPNGIACIGNYVFSGGSNITKVTIPNSITSIGEYAFYDCSSLASITIPESVTSIASSAFYSCSNMTSVTINSNEIVSREYKSNSTIGSIFGSQVTEYILGNEVTSIGDYAFYKCTNLNKVVIGKNTTIIGQCAFSGCTSLSTINFSNSVTNIGNSAFSGCVGLTNVSIPNNVTSIGGGAFSGCVGLVNITIPNSVASVEGSTFSGCTSLTNVTIPSSVTSIGTSAFYGCAGLTNVTIPSSVTSIEASAFSNCVGITSISIGKNVASLGKAVFKGCTSLTSVIWNAKNCAIQNDFANVPYFDGNCTQITIFTFGDEVESIPNQLCYGMSALTSISIPNSAKTIGSGAFEDCSNLNNITLGDNINTIGRSSFSGCRNLTSINIPNSVTSVYDYAFSGCNGLLSFTTQCQTPPTLGSDVFKNCYNLVGIYVPCGTQDAYKRAWSQYSSCIAYTPTGYSINARVNMTDAGNVAVLNSVCETSVTANPNYGYHFVQWSDGNTDNPRTIELTRDTTFTAEFAKNSYSITTASSNQEWGTTAGDATVLYQEQAVISATANYGYHFTQWNDGYSSNPRTITVTKDATYTATFAKNTYKITKITDNTQGSISGYSQAYFLDQVTLTAVPKYGYHFTQWSDGVTDNPRTFELTRDTTFAAEFAVDKSGTCGDNNLLTWEFDAESKTLAISGEGQLNSNYTFGVEAPTQTERLIIEEGVTSIGNNAFKDKCATVTSLALPSTVTAIGDYAFAGLSNRKFNTLVLPNTIISIGSHAFDGASYLQTIHFGSVLEEIGDYAFNGCTRVRKMTCLAEITPNVGTDGLTSISDLAELHVPNDYLFDYQLDNNWNRFVLKPIGATEATVTGNDVTIVADENSATITWPISEADSYTIEITKDGEVFCQLIFNASGQLTSIAFAPSRGGQSMAPAATMTANGMQFTVTGLNSGTNYGYKMEAKSGSATVASYSGSFATTGGVATEIGEMNATTATQKVIRNGKVLIIRDGKTYDLQGHEVSRISLQTVTEY